MKYALWPAALLFLLEALVPVAGTAQSNLFEAPSYSSAGIVNAASSEAAPLSPNCLATIYGQKLAFAQAVLTATDPLPTSLGGVRVTIAGTAATPIFVSPGQINFRVPPNIKPGLYKLQVSRDSIRGPEVDVILAAASPALFVAGEFAIATTAAGAVLSAQNPARGGDVVVLYATGLGGTNPAASPTQVARQVSWVTAPETVRVLLDDVEIPPSGLYYAGLTPGFAGLYQINVMLPGGTGQNPRVQVRVGEAISPAAVKLNLQNLQK